MGKKLKFGDIFQPGDILALFVIVIGIVIAVFINGIAYKLIGVSVSILGTLALVMLVSQRLSEVVESNKFNLPQQPYDFKMTVVKDSAAKRQTVENFDDSFGSAAGLDQDTIATMGADEGFRIVSKSSRVAAIKSEDSILTESIALNNEKVQSIKNEIKKENPEAVPVHSVNFSDGKHLKKPDSEPVKDSIIFNEEKSLENSIHTATPETVSESQFEASSDNMNNDGAENQEQQDAAQNILNNVASEKTRFETPIEDKQAIFETIQEEPAPVISDNQENNLKTDNPTIITDSLIHEPFIGTMIDPVEAAQAISDYQIIESSPEPILSAEMDINNRTQDSSPSLEITNDISPEINVDEPLTDNSHQGGEVFNNDITTENIQEIPAENIQEPLGEILQELESEKTPYKKKQMEVPFSLLMEDEPNISLEPRKEFEFFVSRALLIIRSVIKTRTVSLILVNAEQKNLILESYITSVPDAITDNIKIPMGNDVVSQIIGNGKPEILTEINPSAELELIPYYKQATGTSSFIGLPIFYEKEVMGIITCDTNEKNAYDASTVSFLGHFSKLISGLIQSYTEKYDLLQAEKTLKAMEKFTKISDENDGNIVGIAKTLVDTVSEMFEIQTVGACLFDETKNGWFVLAINSTIDSPRFFNSQPVDLSNTMLGSAIINSNPIIEVPFESGRIRVNPKESPLLGGYFIAVPIRTQINTFGAIFLEGTSNSALNNIDTDILQKLAESAGQNIEKLNLIKMIQTGSLSDPETGLLNGIAFFHRLQEEIARVRDFKSPATLCLVSIDKYSAFESEDNQDNINSHCINLINKQLHEYDIFGKVDASVYAVLLIGQSIEKAKIWAERIRNSSAISVMEVDNRRFTITLSMGIAQVSYNDDINLILENCSKVLSIASNKTNCVQVYQ